MRFIKLSYLLSYIAKDAVEDVGGDEDRLLLESGDALLLENGDNLLLE
jgi:hypothetical protein